MVIAGIKDRNIRIIKRVNKKFENSFMLCLYGLDGKKYYSSKRFVLFENLFKKIDKMPLRIKEMNDKKYKPVDKKKYTLYSDDNPYNTIKNTGFKNKDVAKNTIKIVESLDNPIRAKQIINTMLNRAKFHPHQTKDMRDAIKIFNKWMIKNK